VGGGFVSSSAPGFVNGKNPHGTAVDDHATVSAPIAIANLPAHKHRTGDVTTADGLHSHVILGWGAIFPLGGHIANAVTANADLSTMVSTTRTEIEGDHAHSLPAHSTVGGDQPLQITPPTLGINFFIKI
jgi:hypothetical protein